MFSNLYANLKFAFQYSWKCYEKPLKEALHDEEFDSRLYKELLEEARRKHKAEYELANELDMDLALYHKFVAEQLIAM